MRHLLVALAALLLLASSARAESADRTIEKSVIHITNYSQRADWDTPWELRSVATSTGTGFFIGGGRIVTNAHVVSDTRVVQVRRFQEATPFAAKVKFVGHDCDLAILEVDDPRFYEGMQPLKLADRVPALRSKVRTYGYPTGGRELSSTEGVVSRYEYHVYSHDQFDSFAAVQTDAAINPGNSGGPVVQDGQVVGVAFQGRSDLQGVGYVIPPPVVEHFLTDVKDGRYDGFADLGVHYSALNSPAYRRFLKLPERASGVVVDDVRPKSAADGVLKRGDVILAVDGSALDNDGKIQVGDHKLTFGYVVDRKQVGEKVAFEVWREGKKLTVEARLTRYAPFERSRRQFDVLPRYFVYAGLVFMPLDTELLSTWGAWTSLAPRRLVWNQLYRWMDEPQSALDEVVVLTRRLPDPVNSTFAFSRSMVVDKVNGRRIRTLKDVAEAFEQHSGARHVIEFQGQGEVEAMSRADAAAAHARVLKTYGIVSDRRL